MDVCSIPPSGSSGNVLCKPEISENHKEIGMEVLSLFPGMGELMNHTWRGLERLLSVPKDLPRSHSLQAI